MDNTVKLIETDTEVKVITLHSTRPKAEEPTVPPQNPDVTKIIQFAVANCPPEYEGWPEAELRAYAATHPNEELRDIWLDFCDEIVGYAEARSRRRKYAHADRMDNPEIPEGMQAIFEARGYSVPKYEASLKGRINAFQIAQILVLAGIAIAIFLVALLGGCASSGQIRLQSLPEAQCVKMESKVAITDAFQAGLSAASISLETAATQIEGDPLRQGLLISGIVSGVVAAGLYVYKKREEGIVDKWCDPPNLFSIDSGENLE